MYTIPRAILAGRIPGPYLYPNPKQSDPHMSPSTEGSAKLLRLKVQKEFLVGLLALLAIALMFVFAWLMGVVGPLGSRLKFHVLYNFAGGVEVGSPVRVSGVKVGRVESIQFVPLSLPSEHAALRVTISVAKKATALVREDSKFYINMAGIIGERYIEVSPGSVQAKSLPDGATIRGEDPPRIDQLLSQGYGVFGKIQDFLDQNEKTISEFLQEVERLMGEANRVLKRPGGQNLGKLIENLAAISGDVKRFTHALSDEKANRFFQEIVDLVDRAHQIDHKLLKQFFQEEGIRARIF